MPEKVPPLYEKMYFRPHYVDLVRMVGYEGLATSVARQKIKELVHDKEKMAMACEELFDIDGEKVKLKAHVRKLAWQLLGKPPEHKETPIEDMIGKKEVVARPDPKPNKPRRKKTATVPSASVSTEVGAQQQPMSSNPLTQQYRQAKERHPGMLLLFRVGDFYELFESDAEEGAKLLGLTLTTRERTTTMAGFPHHQLEAYLHKLLKAGKRVAICDQVDSADGKSVKQEVQRVVMPAKTPDETADELEEVIGQLAAPESVQAEVTEVAGVKTIIPVRLRKLKRAGRATIGDTA